MFTSFRDIPQGHAVLLRPWTLPFPALYIAALQWYVGVKLSIGPRNRLLTFCIQNRSRGVNCVCSCELIFPLQFKGYTGNEADDCAHFIYWQPLINTAVLPSWMLSAVWSSCSGQHDVTAQIRIIFLRSTHILELFGHIVQKGGCVYTWLKYRCGCLLSEWKSNSVWISTIA